MHVVVLMPGLPYVADVCRGNVFANVKFSKGVRETEPHSDEHPGKDGCGIKRVRSRNQIDREHGDSGAAEVSKQRILIGTRPAVHSLAAPASQKRVQTQANLVIEDFSSNDCADLILTATDVVDRVDILGEALIPLLIVE